MTIQAPIFHTQLVYIENISELVRPGRYVVRGILNYPVIGIDHWGDIWLLSVNNFWISPRGETLSFGSLEEIKSYIRENINRDLKVLQGIGL